MQCFICVTYMMILCAASPPGTREIATTHGQRSLFRDVIESLRIRAQLPEDFNHNNLAQNYDNDDNEPSGLPSDADYIPRRNDRIETPSMKYRFPKSVDINESDVKGTAKPQHEVVLYIDDRTKTTTQKPKQDKRPKPNENKVSNKYKDEDNAGTESQTDNVPFTNNMAGQSQIGNRESQTVIKPTVIVNIRGSVIHRDSEIRLTRKQDNTTRFYTPLNIFNINQDVQVEKEPIRKGLRSEFRHEVQLLAETDSKVDGEMLFETATVQTGNNQDDDKSDNVLQILLSI